MSDTYLNPTGLSALKAWVLQKIIEGSGGSAAMASMFEIAMADEYYVTDESEAPNIISNALNLDGFVTPIGTSGISWKKPTVSIPTIDWSTTVDENYNITGTGTVQVHFGNAGAISKTVTFKKPGEGKLYAVSLEDKTAAIDTGILANYAYTFRAKGYAGGSTSSLIGAYVSNSERTTLRMQPSSGQVQAMWPSNVQIAKTTHGLEPTQEIEYTIKASGVTLTQGSKTYTQNFSGTASGNPNANIHLLNETVGGAQGSSILCEAEILQGTTQVAFYAPFKLNSNEVVIINTSGLTAQQIYDIVQNGDSSSYASGRIFRPSNGALLEVAA